MKKRPSLFAGEANFSGESTFESEILFSDDRFEQTGHGVGHFREHQDRKQHTDYKGRHDEKRRESVVKDGR